MMTTLELTQDEFLWLCVLARGHRAALIEMGIEPLQTIHFLNKLHEARPDVILADPKVPPGKSYVSCFDAMVKKEGM